MSTEGALRAARAICQDVIGLPLDSLNADDFAQIIDEESGLAELLDAAKELVANLGSFERNWSMVDTGFVAKIKAAVAKSEDRTE